MSVRGFERGDFVLLELDEREPMPAMVVLSSGNGLSLMVMFDGLLDGCLGAMPLFYADGAYHNVMSGHSVRVRLSTPQP